MQTARNRSFAAFVALFAAGSAAAQGLPTSQPNIVTIIREEVKVGRAADHEKIEAGWPAAYAKAKSQQYYLAMTSLTGQPEAWFIVPNESNAQIGAQMKADAANKSLTAELDRLSKADAEVISGMRTITAVARKDLSMGEYPDMALMRFWEITWFRVRPGHEAQFDAAAKAYIASAGRVNPKTSFRVYEVTAGMNGPAYLLFASVANYGDFDKMMEDGMKTMTGMTADEMAAMNKFNNEGMNNFETERFALSAAMSFVSAETKAKDAAFWNPKKTP